MTTWNGASNEFASAPLIGCAINLSILGLEYLEYGATRALNCVGGPNNSALSTLDVGVFVGLEDLLTDFDFWAEELMIVAPAGA